MKIIDGKLHIDAEAARTLGRAKEICFELSQLKGVGLLGISAGQAFVHLDELCQALDAAFQAHLNKS